MIPPGFGDACLLPARSEEGLRPPPTSTSFTARAANFASEPPPNEPFRCPARKPLMASLQTRSERVSERAEFCDAPWQ